ncbi:Serine/threonine-protein phosphatase 2A activator 2 [Thecaphora frezii]
MPTSIDPVATSEPAKDFLATKLKAATDAAHNSFTAGPSNPQRLTPPSSVLSPTPGTNAPITIVSLQDTAFAVPTKRIVSPASLERFKNSETFAEIMSFVEGCNASVVGKMLVDDVYTSDATRAVLGILEEVRRLLRDTPADHSGPSSRFGNPAFKTFYAKIHAENDRLHRLIPQFGTDSAGAARKELAVYLQESWGNEKRIDYGSGMELNFACWLLCLCKLKIFDLSVDGPALVLKVFWTYIQVMREIQSTYWLEPAGSHGVWGLDDYHFLPFLWGSGQLSNHKYLRPKSIHDVEITEEFAGKFMYFACIQFINSVKTESLRWHSPMLDDISSVKTWSKVNEGMIKMYRAEVLLKLPIAQHIFFGSLLRFPEAAEGEEDEGEGEEDEHGHVHAAGKPHGHAHGAGEGQAAGWGDCCGIPIPSVFAAAEEERKKRQGATPVVRGEKAFGSNVRRIPFD